MVNCRNTAPIGEAARKLAGIESLSACRSAEGVKPEVITYSNDSDQIDQLALLLDKWISQGDLSPHQIVILSPFKRANSAFSGEKVGRWRICDLHRDATDEPTTITFSTIHAFKGLEADAIIMVDINGNEWPMNAQTLYVAVSRAKHLLTICAYKDVHMEKRLL